MSDYSLNSEEKLLLLHTARETISSALEKRKAGYKTPGENLMTDCGAFVTLHKNGRLRGCIGHILAIQPLFEAVKELAVHSAFRDPRFRPLSREEFDEIDIEISVLTPLERIKDTNIVEPGKHGLYIKKGHAAGVLLPQVAVEQGWDRINFLNNTCIKAGLNPSCWKDPDCEIFIFKAIIFGEKTNPVL